MWVQEEQRQIVGDKEIIGRVIKVMNRQQFDQGSEEEIRVFVAEVEVSYLADVRVVLQDKSTARLSDSQAGGRQGGGEVQDVRPFITPFDVNLFSR